MKFQVSKSILESSAGGTTLCDCILAPQLQGMIQVLMLGPLPHARRSHAPSWPLDVLESAAITQEQGTYPVCDEGSIHMKRHYYWRIRGFVNFFRTVAGMTHSLPVIRKKIIGHTNFGASTADWVLSKLLLRGYKYIIIRAFGLGAQCKPWAAQRVTCTSCGPNHDQTGTTWPRSCLSSQSEVAKPLASWHAKSLTNIRSAFTSKLKTLRYNS